MKEIIRIQEKNGKQAVSARELHYFLEVGRDFSTWCKQMFDYGLEEDKDFTPFSGKSTGGRPSTDYALTLDCAKEIAMIQRTPKGKQARQYFIECEKKYKQNLKAIDTPEVVMAKALLMAKETMDKQQQEIEVKQKQLALKETQIQHQAPVIEYANKVLSSTSGHTPTTIASELNMSAVTLNRMLVKARFLRRTGKRGEYGLYANYQGKDYVIEHTHDYERPDGSTGTKISLEYTERGRMKIHEITNRAINAGVLEKRNGRYFINYNWEPVKQNA